MLPYLIDETIYILLLDMEKEAKLTLMMCSCLPEKVLLWYVQDHSLSSQSEPTFKFIHCCSILNTHLKYSNTDKKVLVYYTCGSLRINLSL